MRMGGDENQTPRTHAMRSDWKKLTSTNSWIESNVITHRRSFWCPICPSQDRMRGEFISGDGLGMGREEAGVVDL